MAGRLEGKKVAFVVTDGFEQVELTEPRAALEAEGAICDVVAPPRPKESRSGASAPWNSIERLRATVRE
jgi:putative intracellular protease/amidase